MSKKQLLGTDFNNNQNPLVGTSGLPVAMWLTQQE
jgi:hypothetical protein